MITSLNEIQNENMCATLVTRIKNAKEEEQAAKTRRIEAERQLIELVEFEKAEGSSSFQCAGLRVTLTGKLIRTLDRAKWEEIKQSIPIDLHPIEYKPSLILKGIRYLENNEPETFRKVAQAVTTKPAKVAVTLKEIED